MLKFLRIPFGQSGDRTAVPDAPAVGGDVSYTDGYGVDYSRPKTDPLSKNIEREKMNQLFFDATTAIGELQAQGIPDFITTVLNGGAPHSYARDALVRHAGDIYTSLVDSNTATPADATKWGRFNWRSSGALTDLGANPRMSPWLAVGDGVADDTAALVAAEAAAFAAGATLVLPAGRVFAFNGVFSTRVSILGYGARIKQTQVAVDGSGANATVKITASGVTIRGLTVDSNFKRGGFSGDGMSDVMLQDCVALNCVNAGFIFYLGNNIQAWRCKASDIRYFEVPSTGDPADGFYFGGCTNSQWVSCAAENFRRIGFVSEGNGATKSAGIRALFCRATDANNCDDSTTEFNAGFWAENTNSVDWLYCVADRIAGNTGQTNGRVVGLVGLAVGNTVRGNCNVIGCRVFGGTGYLPNGISVSGSGTFADVLVENCYVSRARAGVFTNCNLNRLTIRNLAVDDIVNTTGAQGGVQIDAAAGANLLPVLEIDKITVTNSVFHADAGAVNFFNSPPACQYTLRNVKGAVPHVMRGAVARVRAEECEVAAGSTTYQSFLGAFQEFVDCVFTSRNASNGDFITKGSALAAGSELVIRGGSITGFGAGWQQDFGGTSNTTRFFGVKFNNVCWMISTGGSYVNIFDGCSFLAVPVTVGAIRTNFTVPTKQVLMVSSCYFESANAADTPIRLWNNAPTNAILQGNVRRLATNLHNLGAVTSDVNNVAV